MTDQQTYKLFRYTVKIVPDAALECLGCVFERHDRCPTRFDELEAGIEQTCIEGNHKYVEVQPT